MSWMSRPPWLVRRAAAVAIIGLVLAGSPVNPAGSAAAEVAPAPNTVPNIQSWSAAEGTSFVLDPRRRIVYDDRALADVARVLAEDLNDLNGMHLNVVDGPVPRPVPGDIFLSAGPVGLGPEGYRLTIDDTVRLEAEAAAGAFYGTRTLLQLLKQGGEHRNQLPRGTVSDSPRFPRRGLMFDVARKFVSVDFLKKYIRQMSWFKLNLLHLHLSDDQAFRLESDVPGLTAPEHYTKAEMADLVRYAKRYHVTILPEIDVPSHSEAILAARPDLGHRCEALASRSLGLLDLSNPDTLPFVTSLIDEYLPLFDGPFHFGADEYPQASIRSPEANRELLLQCPEMADRARQLGYDDPGDIYRDFIDELTRHVEGRGGQAWIWTWFDYVGTKALETRPVLDDWEGTNVKSLAASGFQVVNSDGTYTYVMPGRRILNHEWLYQVWQPSQWSPLSAGNQLDPADPQLIGMKVNIWNPPLWTPSVPEAAIDRETSVGLPVYAEKAWGAPTRASFAEFTADAAQVGNAPGYGFGQIGNYRFEDSDASTPGEDTSGAGNHGQIHGAQPTVGRYGSGLSFGGGDDRVFLGGTDVSGEWTAALWVNRKASGQSAAILLDSERFSVRLEQVSTGKVGLTEYGGGSTARGGRRDYSFDYAVPVGEWVHLGFVGTPTSTRLYVNGELVDTLDRGFDLPRDYLGGPVDAFAGVLDEVKMYDTALDATGIRSLYEGLVASYSFEEKSGRTVIDGSGLGNNGGLSGPTRTAGHDGGALEFQGGGSMVYTGMPYGISDQWTASMWLKRGSVNQTAETLLSSALTGYSIRSEQYRTGRVGFTHTGDPTRSDYPPVHSPFDASFDYSVPVDGSWVHLTFVGTGDRTALYVDGELVSASTRTIELPIQFIGVMSRYGSVGGTNSAAGTIDEVRIFDRALSDAEVRGLAAR